MSQTMLKWVYAGKDVGKGHKYNRMKEKANCKANSAQLPTSVAARKFTTAWSHFCKENNSISAHADIFPLSSTLPAWLLSSVPTARSATAGSGESSALASELHTKGVGNVLSVPFPHTNENKKAPVIW